MFDNDFELPDEPIDFITEEMALSIEAEIEEDQKCNADLDAGLTSLFTCIKPWDNCKVGSQYNIRVDNLATDLSDQWSGTPFEKFIQDIPVVYWVYVDGGLGTPKKRVIFNGNFSEYFT